MDSDLQRRRIARSRWIGLSRAVVISPVLTALVAVSPGAANAATTASGEAGPAVAGSPGVGLNHSFAVGMPARATGVLNYYDPGGNVLVLTPGSIGLTDNGFPVRFGAAVATLNPEVNTGPDLVVGTPGNGTEKIAGRVDLVTVRSTGITAGQTVGIESPGPLGDDFGATVAVSVLSYYEPEAPRYLWIGAPGTTVQGHPNAGAVYRYSLSPSGQVALLDTITQDSALVPGVSETGDRFGEVLAAAGGSLIVGVPHEDIGSATDAGAVQLLRTAPSPSPEATQATPLIAAWSWDQNSPGAPGMAETGDRFGAAVSGNGPVGVPGEDLGNRKDAGAVQGFGRAPGDAQQPPLSALISQDSPGVPGAAEAGDQFGAALTFGTYDCYERDRIAVGAPGEDLRGKADAGSVTLFGSDSCPATVLSQGKGLKGAAETGDRAGSTLTTLTGNPELEDARHDNLLIGAPGEDITADGRTFRDAGRVLVWGDGRSPARIFGSQWGDEVGLRYGSVLSSEDS
jgi:hypothetical protein